MFVMLLYKRNKFIVGILALLVASSTLWLDIKETHSVEPALLKQPLDTAALIKEVLPEIKDLKQTALLKVAGNNDTSQSGKEDAPLPSKNATSTSEANELSNAMRLRIKFLGYAELTGDYNISNDQIISFPVLGRVTTEGLDTAGLEKILAGKVSKVTKKDAYVTVEILEYRPIFVNGFIMNPGSYAWKPGMNVLQAITLSGGLYRERLGERESSGLLLRSINEEKTRLRNAVAELKVTLAILARHQAELRNAEKIDVPKRLIELVGAAEAQKLIDTQYTIFNSHQSNIKTQFATLEEGVRQAEIELKGFETQREIMEKQLSLQREIMKGIQTLRVQQNVNNNRFLTEQLRVMEIEERSTTSVIEIARAKGRMLTLQREISNTKLRIQADIVSQIERRERESAQQETTISAAQTAYRNLTGQDVSTSDNRDKPAIHYTISRRTSSGSEMIEANQFTELKPGDILMIENGLKEAAQVNRVSQR